MTIFFKTTHVHGSSMPARPQLAAACESGGGAGSGMSQGRLPLGADFPGSELQVHTRVARRLGNCELRTVWMTSRDLFQLTAEPRSSSIILRAPQSSQLPRPGVERGGSPPPPLHQSMPQCSQLRLQTDRAVARQLKGEKGARTPPPYSVEIFNPPPSPCLLPFPFFESKSLKKKYP